jgi:hypothetical protein
LPGYVETRYVYLPLLFEDEVVGDMTSIKIAILQENAKGSIGLLFGVLPKSTPGVSWGRGGGEGWGRGALMDGPIKIRFNIKVENG